MHYPANIHLGEHSVPVHFVCETLSYFIGYQYYSFLRKHHTDQISNEHRIVIFVGAAFGAFFGSHILGVLEQPLLLPRINLIYFMGNTTIVGGLLGGLLGVELTKRQIGVKVSSGDLMAYPIMLAMIVGRLGCHFAGLEDGTYGVESHLPWAINFGDGVPRHPTNLYEIVFWVILWISLSSAERKYRLEDGLRFKFLMTAYLLFRFCIEFIKPAYFFNFGLSSIQLACLVGLLYYYKVLIHPFKTIKRNA